MSRLPKPYYRSRDGKIVLYCGDARELLPKLSDRSADFIFTDAPYGHNNNNGDLIHRREAAIGRPAKTRASMAPRPIAGDGPEANDLVRWLFGESRRLLAPGCCCCCCGGGGPDPQFARWSLWLDAVLDFKQMVVWDKGSMGMGWHYRRSYETVLVAQKPGAACRWFDKSKRIENVIRPGDGICKIIPRAHEHPTAKPWQLASHFIQLHTQPGDVVLDPFSGAGSTMEASARTRRRFVGVELDAGYCEMAVRRLKVAKCLSA